jgi:hypothetical protein
MLLLKPQLPKELPMDQVQILPLTQAHNPLQLNYQMEPPPHNHQPNQVELEPQMEPRDHQPLKPMPTQ